MIQNSRTTGFPTSFFVSATVVAISLGWAANAFSQVVNSAAFDTSADHSILEVADEGVTSAQNQAAQLSSASLTRIAQDDAAYGAPAAPRPRMTGAKPLVPNTVTFEGNSQGTFTSSNPANKSATSNSFWEPNESSRPENSNTVVTATANSNSAATVYSQTSAPQDQEGQTEEPKYESAYLHDQQPQRDTPVQDLFSSPDNSHPLSWTVQQPKASQADQNFQASERNFIQQTAFLSPAAPAQPQFQNTGVQQQNRPQFGQPQTAHRGQQNQPAQIRSQPPLTQQRNLPRNNQTQSQPQPQPQSQPIDSTAAKQAIAKFSFDANQQLAQGLPISMGDILQQSAGRVSRSQLIPQYWEVYYDWAQSVSAKHHLDWVSSINSAQRNDASSIEIAKSNAQNEITFTAIQLGKSQARLKSLTGTPQPIVPMDSPTVTRVKTNYQAFKNRGMIPPKFEGIDATLTQMHALIASRANTVTMAQKNADQAKQLYASNQSTVDHVLAAGRTWRTAESDFIASVVEYNKAYAHYALALPYGRGPIQTVVNMLIVKPTTNQSTGNQAASGRPNLSNNTEASLVSQSNTSGNDYSVPYSSNQPNQQNGRSAQSLQGQQPNLTSSNHGGLQHAFNSTGPSNGQPINAQPSNSGQASAAHHLMQNTRQASTPRPGAKPLSGFNASGQAPTGLTNANAGAEGSSPRTNYIKRPSQFPSQQRATGASPFSSGNSNQRAAQRRPPVQPNQPAQKSFQPRPGSQTPIGDRTATRPSPFTPAGASSAPGSTSKPPTNGGGFSFGG